jgi:DNA modification methylase
MKIANRKIEDIIPYEKNPRKNDGAVDKTAMSLKEYGWQQPIVLDKKGVIIAGHTRLKAAKKLGLKTCPVVVAENLTKAQVKAYRIADNKTSEFATWNDELLGVEMQDLLDMNFDIELTGFDASDFDFGDKSGLTDDDAVPEVPEEPVIKLGDLWLLGEHRLLCGDSTDIKQVERLMDGQKADMVFTDPPYGMNLDTDWSGAKSSLKFAKEKNALGGKKHKQVIGDHEDFTPELITTVLENFKYCKEIFLWGADYYSEYLTDKNDGSWVVWDKRLDESADKMYGSTFELCWSKSRHKRMIARIKWAGIFGTEKEFDHKRHHPTQKPILLVEWFFDYYSIKNKVNIVDLYLGSGSTLIACEKTNRKCYGMELDEHYCDVIIKRWEDYTGKKAILKKD